MTVTPTADEQAIREVASRLFAGRAPLAKQHELAGRGAVELPRELFAKLGELDFFTQSLPEAAGGLGLSTLTSGLILEAAGRELVPGPLVDHFVALRISSGSEEAGDLARGDQLAAVAFPAPGARSGVRLDPASGTVSGEVSGLAFGDLVDLWVVPVSPATGGAGHVAIGASDSTGVEVARDEPSVDPLWCSASGRLSDVRPVAVLALSSETLDAHVAYGSILAAAYAVGASARLLDDTVTYAKDRRQFGRAIGSFQAVKHHLADARIDLLHTRSLVYRALDDDASAHQRRVARLAADGCYRLVAGKALQVHGGIGFTAESPVHLFVKNAQRLRAWPVPAAVDRERLRAALGLDRS